MEVSPLQECSHHIPPQCIPSLLMSALFCMCAPAAVYNYSDIQGDSPNSRGRQREMKRERVAGDKTKGWGRQATTFWPLEFLVTLNAPPHLFIKSIHTKQNYVLGFFFIYILYT